MMPKCKTCKKEMKDVSKDDLFSDYDKFLYECHNEDCIKPFRKIISVCKNCENETKYWEEM